MHNSSVQFSRGRLLAVLSVLTFGLTALAAVVDLESLVPIILMVGFFIVVPLVALLGDSLPVVESETDGVHVGRGATVDDPIARLRSRYANGELTDEEFEHRLERLLETEDTETTGPRPRDQTFERE